MSDETVHSEPETTAHIEAAPANGDAVPAEEPVAAQPADPAPADNEAPPAEQPPAEEAPAAEEAPPVHETPAAVVAQAPEAPKPRHDDPSMDLSSEYSQSMRQLTEGDVITGTVMRVDREGILVDVGAKSEGIIRLNELSRDPAAMANPESVVSVGEEIQVYVMEPENAEGNPILSKKRADFEKAWVRVQHSLETKETIHAMVTERVKGGLTVDLGIRGFVPASHVGSGSLKVNLDRYVGQSIPLKVIEVDKERRKVVLSNKNAVAQERAQRSEQTRRELAEGATRRGIVRRLTTYGAFVDLGGIDGLLHISEMSWTRINDPHEVLREGQEIDVLILSVNLETDRVSLSLRQIQPDPWGQIAALYKEGDEISGTISRVVGAGAFVLVEGGVEGIIPTSEMPRDRMARGGVPIEPGSTVEVKVLAVRPAERRLTLSARALVPNEPRAAAPQQHAGEAPTGGGTGGGGRRQRGRDRGPDDEDMARYTGGRHEEPRFTIADAMAAQRRDKPKRERYRTETEEEDDYSDLDLDVSTSESAEEPAAAPVEAAPEESAEE